MADNNRTSSAGRAGRLKNLLAVDFDRSEVRLARASKKRGGVRISSLLCEAIPPELNIEDASAVGAFLAETFKKHHLTGIPLVMAVPRGKTILKPLAFPPDTSKQQLPQMVRYKVGGEIPFPLQDVVVDFSTDEHFTVDSFQITRPDDASAPSQSPPPQEGQTQPDETEDAADQTDNPPDTSGKPVFALAAAVQNNVVEYYRSIASASGSKLASLSLQPWATMHCVDAIAGGQTDKPILIATIRKDETGIDILDNGRLAFSRSAAISITDPADNDCAGDITSQIIRSVQTCQAVHKSPKPELIYIAGTTGLEQKVIGLLSEQLSIPVEMFNPLDKREDAPSTVTISDKCTIPHERGSGCVGVIGLAVSCLGKTAPDFDFLHPKRPARRRDPAAVKTAWISVAVVLGIIVAYIAGSSYLDGKEQRNRRLQKKYNETLKANKSAKATANKVEAIEKWACGGKTTFPRREAEDFLENWTIIASVIPSCDDIYITTMRTAIDGTISLDIRSKSTAAIAELSRKLTDAGYKIKPGSTSHGNDSYGYKYRAEMKVIVPKNLKIDLASLPKVSRPSDDTPASEFRAERPKKTQWKQHSRPPIRRPTR